MLQPIECKPSILISDPTPRPVTKKLRCRRDNYDRYTTSGEWIKVYIAIAD
jgi:hypothetical protein